MQKAAEAGIAATGAKSLARHRLTQMRDFYDFLLGEIPALLDRWPRSTRKVGPGEPRPLRRLMIVERQNIIDAPSGAGVGTHRHAGGHQRRTAAVDDDVDAARRGVADRRRRFRSARRWVAAGCGCSACCRSTTTT